MIVSFEQMLEKAKQGEPMVLAGAAAQDVVQGGQRAVIFRMEAPSVL